MRRKTSTRLGEDLAFRKAHKWEGFHDDTCVEATLLYTMYFVYFNVYTHTRTCFKLACRIAPMKQTENELLENRAEVLRLVR